MVGFKSTIIFMYWCVGGRRFGPELTIYSLNLSDIFLSESYVGRMSFNKLQSIKKFQHYI